MPQSYKFDVVEYSNVRSFVEKKKYIHVLSLETWEREREREKLMLVSIIEEFKTSIDSKQKRTRAINDDMNKLKSVLMFYSLELVSLIPFWCFFFKLGEFLRNILKKIVLTFSFNDLFYIYKAKLRKTSLDLRTWNIKIEENREYMNRALVLLSSPGKNHSRSQHEAITFSS